MSLKLSLLCLIFTAIGFSKGRPYQDLIKESLRGNKCTLTKENIYLTKEQVKKIEKRIQTSLSSSLSLRFIEKCPGQDVVYHYVDSHIVRTLNETVIISVQNDQVIAYQISSFNEPPEYIAPRPWLAQFFGKKESDDMAMYKNIDALSGATLTARAGLNATLKVLTVHGQLKSL